MRSFFFLVFIRVCFCTAFVAGYEKPVNVSSDVWEALQPYFLDEAHPIKTDVESLFSDPEIIKSLTTMHDAGFEIKGPQKWSRIVVAKHSKVPGYLFKIYLDEIAYPGSHCDYQYWQRRIDGARKIELEIIKKQISDKFKVPKKWIYPLSRIGKERQFILIVEEMDLLKESENSAYWASKKISKEFLEFLWDICESIGLRDSLKPDNIPFCKDGKIAFIDTEQHHCWPLRPEPLTPYLREDLRVYWEKLGMKNRNKKRPKKGALQHKKD